jgi:hypothetical protein
MSLGEWIVNTTQKYILEQRNAHFEMADKMADAVETIGALPLWCDWNGGVAIRPDSELIGFHWDDAQSAQIETDPHLRFLDLFTGAKRYPELSALLPTRTTGDRDCPVCNGTGIVSGLEEHGIDPNVTGCYCGGAGWLPSAVPNPPCY